MNSRTLILRGLGGAIFAGGIYWFYTILGSHATAAILIAFFGIELVRLGMAPGKAK
jgi:hypothetical protein